MEAKLDRIREVFKDECCVLRHPQVGMERIKEILDEPECSCIVGNPVTFDSPDTVPIFLCPLHGKKKCSICGKKSTMTTIAHGELCDDCGGHEPQKPSARIRELAKEHEKTWEESRVEGTARVKINLDVVPGYKALLDYLDEQAKFSSD